MLKLIRKKLSYKLFFIYLTAISIPIVIYALTSYYLLALNMEEEFIRYRNNINMQLLKSLEENVYNIEKQSASVFINLTDIVDITSKLMDNKIDDDYLNARKRTENYLLSLLQYNDRIDGIGLINVNGDVQYYINKDFSSSNLISVKDEKWFQEVLSLRGSPLVLDPHDNTLVFNPDKSVEKKIITIARTLYFPENNSNALGVIVFDQKISQLEAIVSGFSSSEGELFLIIGREGKILFGKGNVDSAIAGYILNITESLSSGYSSFKFDYLGNEMLANCNISSDIGWKVLSIIPVSELKKRSSFLKNITILLLPILMFFILLISILVSNFITIPLKRLMSSFKKLQSGDFNTNVQVNGEDELSEIGRTFNTMVLSIKTLIDQKYEANIMRKQAELESLQSQINPHFLFNTLNSVKLVSDKGASEKTSLMIQNLSDLFRYSLHRGVYIVGFSEELDNIKKYLYLQECRFEGKYEVIYDIDDDVLDYEIVRLTLQPIIENALYHGLEPKVEKGELRIAAKEISGKFIIYVSDNGKGIPEEDLEQINCDLEHNIEDLQKLSPSRIGIHNVNARIKFHFGNEYGMKIYSSYGSNTTVKLTLPVRSRGVVYHENSYSR